MAFKFQCMNYLEQKKNVKNVVNLNLGYCSPTSLLIRKTLCLVIYYTQNKIVKIEKSIEANRVGKYHLI